MKTFTIILAVVIVEVLIVFGLVGVAMKVGKPTIEPNTDFHTCMERWPEDDQYSDSSCEYCELLSTDAKRNILFVNMVKEGDKDSLFNVTFVEPDTAGFYIVDTFGLDYLSLKDYELLIKHSKPF